MLLILTKTYILVFNLYNVSFIMLLTFSFSLFVFNLLAIGYNHRNLLIIFLSIEVLFLSVGLNFIFFSLVNTKISQVISLFVLAIASTESSIGISILINFYRLKQNINFKSLSDLKY
jgi:NADH-quinone oxidoreductase subunit K